MKSILFRFTTSLFVLTVFTAGTAMAANQIDLAVEDNGGSLSLVVTGNELPCGSGEPLNCIEVKKGKSPHMFFNLPKACKNGGPDYRLTEFRITQTNKVWPTSTNPMDTEVAKDFCADRNNGYVELRNCNNSRKDDRLKIKNFNSLPATVYYEITAENCSGSGDRIYLDPQIKNRGTQ